jgi:aryl-alcohol dehydrogenase-like predicted oxidoreductase
MTLPLTKVGLGAWAMGGGEWMWGWGPQDPCDSAATLQVAAAAGIGWVDTAASYGLGRGEEVIGTALRAMPAADRPMIFTKGGTQWAPGDRAAARVGAPAAIRRQCEASLRRLGLDSVDLYQLHWPSDDGTPVEDTWQAMSDLVDTGLARHIGVCNFDVSLLERCEAVRHVDALQIPLSLIDRRALADIVPWARVHRVPVIAYSPMQSGLLTGTFSQQRVDDLDDADWRKGDPEFQMPALGRTLAFVESLQALASAKECSVAALAVAWALHGGASGAAVGARRPRQLTDWVHAGDIKLGSTDLEVIADLCATHRPGTLS